MKYRVIVDRAAQKQFQNLSSAVQDRIRPLIDALADNPRPPGVKKLRGPHDHYRIRAGDWRIVYTILDRELIVLVVKIGHRREVYR